MNMCAVVQKQFFCLLCVDHLRCISIYFFSPVFLFTMTINHHTTASNAVAELEKIVHANEYKARTAAGHP